VVAQLVERKLPKQRSLSIDASTCFSLVPNGCPRIEASIRPSPQNGGMALLGITDTDVAALGGLGTLILAGVAVAQIRESRRQTGAMEDQVTAIGDVAEEELRAMREDIQASIEHGRAVREASLRSQPTCGWWRRQRWRRT
jgi:hypothetical protein